MDPLYAQLLLFLVLATRHDGNRHARDFDWLNAIFGNTWKVPPQHRNDGSYKCGVPFYEVQTKTKRLIAAT